MANDKMMPTTIEQLLCTVDRGTKAAFVRFPDHIVPGGKPLVIQIRELSYNEVAAIKQATADSQLRIVLAGTVAPSFKELAEKMSVPTPFDAIKSVLSAGEIEELSLRIEQLSGFRRRLSEIVEDIEKN